MHTWDECGAARHPMEQEHLGVLHTGGDARNQWAVEGGCKNVKIGGRVEEGRVMTGQHSRKDPWHRDFDQ